MSRFDYVKYDQKAQNIQQELKAQFEKLEAYVLQFISEGRARSLMLTAMEEAYMWSGKGLRDDQIAREKAIGMGVPAEHVERG